MDILPGLLAFSQWLDEKGKAIKRGAQVPIGILQSPEKLNDVTAWLDNKKRQIVTNASDPALLYTRANEDARKFQREELENWGLLGAGAYEQEQ